MPVRLRHTATRIVPGTTRRVWTLTVGRDNTGRLHDLQDLEDALEWIEESALRQRARNGAHWTIQRFIQDPDTGRPILTAVLSSRKVYNIPAFREEGLALVEKAISAVEAGVSYLSASGSDSQGVIDPYDLGYLQNALDEGETVGWFELEGYIA